MRKLALGDIDPISKEEFKEDENEKYLVQLALQGKTQAQKPIRAGKGYFN